jgi:heat-inducible transcriptional repressor
MLNDRKQKILNAIVEIYTRTGEPVGSKSLCEELDISLSPATVRKEMADLISEGYLIQPHTSAGRIPSELGYRNYVDNLMPNRELSPSQKEAIRNLFPKACEPDKLLDIAANALAKLTNCTVFTSQPTGKDTKIRKIEIVYMGKRAAMLVVVTGSGVIKTRFCYGFSGITEDFCSKFSTVANDLLAGQRLVDVDEEMMKKIALLMPDYILTVAPILSEFGNLISEAGISQIKLEGEANMFNHKEIDTESAQNILGLLTKQEALSEMMRAKTEVLSVLIGEETSYYQMKGTSVVMSSYRLSGGDEGQIGIVGPVRMNYPKMMSSIDYFAKVLSEIYNDMLDDNE